MSDDLRGRVVALIGRGNDLDRRIAVLCAEAGASLALGTVADTKDQEFAVNSIANEAWSIGVENFAHQMYAWNADAAAGFARATEERLGSCDVVVVNSSVWSRAPFEELTEEEWENAVRGTLSVPFMIAQAFGRGMASRGTGLIVVVSPQRDDGDLAEQAALGGVRALVAGLAAWGRSEGVGCVLVDGAETLAAEAGGAAVFALILAHVGRGR